MHGAAAQRRTGAARRLGWGAAAAIGYILSPLSPWNDAIVNVPLAYAIAKLLHAATGLNEFIGFQLGYLATNVAGMALLVLGAAGAAGRIAGRRGLARALLLSIAYSLAASLILSALGLLEPP